MTWVPDAPPAERPHTAPGARTAPASRGGPAFAFAPSARGSDEFTDLRQSVP
jgi:hypothetical protein